ncbi:ABC transporter ATP-binding protein [Thermoactinomyces sp. CICC 10523]|uniref:ABC transporter ATP-binding protein n=1 Tax=Thermoactinomyces sp. CICC 10523 TaxID=2767428 RepID=UPI0018DD3C04|nr:ABC transporter ATP-binding protein [Thermoactinomyces sp. CICC 10523]MBH8599232.1 ABC transporter ATP-binding protein [Thermoactinomyces sp. CICC 10523]
MIQIAHLKKRYGNKQALDGISLSIPSGICFGLIGPNGAGKSTLMKILCGVLEEYEGEVSMNGIDIRERKAELKRKIGYVPQDIVLHETLTARDNLMFFGSMYRMKGNELRQRVDEVLRLVGLAERGNDPVKSFSGGMKRRINIGCALMHNPDFIIMDEPTVGVDPQSRNYIFEMIYALKEDKKTILYSSHYMEEVEAICEEIALVDNGKVLESGDIAGLIDKYSTAGVYLEADGVSAESLQNFGEVLAKKDGWLICSEDPLGVMNQLALWLKQQEISVGRLELSKMTLEDIFLSLTGKSLRD